MSTTTAAVEISALTEGSELPSHTFPAMTRTDIVKYQGASGDFHPLHHDEEFARKVGYDGVFSVGMLQAGMLATYVTDLFGVGGIRRYSVRFVEQVWPGDELTCTGTVTSVATTDDGSTVLAVDLVQTRPNGLKALTGSAEFVVSHPAG